MKRFQSHCLSISLVLQACSAHGDLGALKPFLRLVKQWCPPEIDPESDSRRFAGQGSNNAMHSGLSLFLGEYPWSSSPARVLCTVRSTSTQAWSNSQPNGSVGLHPPGQISIACVARESRCWSVYPQVCLLWAVTAKVLHVCENSTKKPQNVQSIGTRIQKSKKWPRPAPPAATLNSNLPFDSRREKIRSRSRRV